MFVHHLGYRHENGTIEGFAGTGITPDSARQHGVALARRAVNMRQPNSFRASRILADLAPLDAESRRAATAGIATRTYLEALR